MTMRFILAFALAWVALLGLAVADSRTGTCRKEQRFEIIQARYGIFEICTGGITGFVTTGRFIRYY